MTAPFGTAGELACRIRVCRTTVIARPPPPATRVRGEPGSGPAAQAAAQRTFIARGGGRRAASWTGRLSNGRSFRRVWSFHRPVGRTVELPAGLAAAAGEARSAPTSVCHRSSLFLSSLSSISPFLLSLSLPPSLPPRHSSRPGAGRSVDISIECLADLNTLQCIFMLVIQGINIHRKV